MPEPIYNITPFTLLDYPGKRACIFWFANCNMACAYCYNPDIVQGKGKISYDAALRFLRSRKGLLDGVVLSGGECTTHKGLPDLIREIKATGMLVKMDTNGSNTPMLRQLLDEGLLDYVALDFKAPAALFGKITDSTLFPAFERSLELLIERMPTGSFEVRSTVHSDLLSSTTLNGMAEWLEGKGYRGTYFLQNFLNDTPTLGKVGNSSEKIRKEAVQTKRLEVMVRN